MRVSLVAKTSGIVRCAKPVERIAKGSIDADLGGGVFKQRVARPGQGRSGGVRAILVIRRGERGRFSFTDSPRATGRIFDETELRAVRNLADEILRLDDADIDAMLENGTIREVNCMAKQYGSEVLASVHETALGMAEAGVYRSGR